MPTILGRDPELSRIRDVLATSAQGHVARAIRIVGPSGIGKTALLKAALAAAPPVWLQGFVASHHIQSSLPLFAARRAAQALLDRLGGEAERYSSGLDLGIEEADVFEESFFRVLEGISLDHPVLLAFDDAQWADRESLSLVESSVRALADRAIVLVSTERSEDTGSAAFDFRDEAIVVHELSDPSSAAIAREIYPEANAAVLDAIVSRAAGRAVDIVTLSESAREQHASNERDVDVSLRRTTARDLALLSAPAREFLQICSLIDDPIEYGILRGLWGESKALEFIAAASDRFLEQRGDSLYFVHDAIKQSVRETIPISIPLHRRIIAAIQAQPTQRLEDYERISQQAAACGDRELQRATLATLGEEAMKRSMYSLAASAWERALDLAQPELEELVPFYSRLSLLYNMLGREPDNIRICRFALEAAQNAGISTGTAQLVTSLAIALSHSGNYTAAKAELARQLDVLTSPPERAQLYSTALYVALSSGDAEALREAQEGYQSVSAHAEPLMQVRVHTYDSIVASRNGDVERAIRSIHLAEESARAFPVARVMPLVAATSHAFLHRGPRGIEQHLASRRKGEIGTEILDLLMLLTHVVRGELDDARTLGAESNIRHRGIVLRRLSLAYRVTGQALHDPYGDDPVWQEVLGEVAAFRTGDESSILIPVATAWLARESKSSPRRAKALLDQLLARDLSMGEPLLMHFPVLLAVAARNVGDNDALSHIASETGLRVSRQPWMQAQHLLARAAASAFLGRPGARAMLDEARAEFEFLEAPFFSSLALRYADNASPVEPKDAGRFGATTRREREIAALVADGLSNREIAEKLVLSERTIEGHIANLFNKLEVSSRTQVAAWYLRATSSVA